MIKSKQKEKGNILYKHNFEKNIVGKLRKFGKIEFSVKCFTTDFLHFSSTTVKICCVGLTGPSPSITSIFRFSWKYFISYILETCEATQTFTDNNLVLLHLWRMKVVLKVYNTLFKIAAMKFVRKYVFSYSPYYVNIKKLQQFNNKLIQINSCSKSLLFSKNIYQKTYIRICPWQMKFSLKYFLMDIWKLIT